MLAPHTLSSKRARPGKRVGRGNGSQKGTTGARGTKGQKSRSGGRAGLKLKGLRKGLMKIPKSRGFKSFKSRAQVITLKQLDAKVSAGQIVTAKWLAMVGLIVDANGLVKIVATGTITKPITLKDCVASKGALEAITKVGGTIVS